MKRPQEPPGAGGRRLSLTKLQRQSAAGAELLSLCQVMTADGSLSEEEVKALRDWLAENRNEDLPAIAHLVKVVETILADGKVTAEECRDLYLAVEDVLPPDIRTAARNARRSIEQQEKDATRKDSQERRAREREERARNAPVDGWDFMVAGCRYEDRPAVINRFAQPGTAASLVRDPHNPHSRYATQVCLDNGKQIGFVPEECAREMAPLLDAGHLYTAHVKKILTGGRFPIPVVVADLYRPDADSEGLHRVSTSSTRSTSSLTNPAIVSGNTFFSPGKVLGFVIVAILIYLLFW